ncbi:hypothetical protein [Halorubrum distributum]|uniref:Uncharacterized protein n=1 Tax=Halorubrum distributum TaxID=29283 RepID=A0A6B1IV71_9EURY|nr:hypothetical protein [Halorubrum terrestre]MYL67035.1 hypothetical protein [Halorubrum terrestre]
MTEKEDSDQENIRDYHLAPKQKDRITSKDELSDASASPGEFLRNIRENKVEKIPDRIDRLFTDVRLLAEADFFTEEWDTEVWEQVDLSKEDWESWEWEPYLKELFEQEYEFDSRRPSQSDIQKETESPQSIELTNFGIELGHTLRLLSDSYLSEDDRFDLLVGIFVGLLQQGPDARYPGDEDVLEDTSGLVDKFEEKVRAWALMDSLSRQSTGSLQTNMSMRSSIIRNCVDSAGLTVSSPLIKYLLEEVEFSPLESEQTDRERTQEQREVESHVEELVENTDIDRVEELIEAVSDSMKLLVSMQGDAEDILSELYLYDGVHHREINYEGKNLQVILSLLAGEHEHSDSERYREWIQKPLIRQTSKEWQSSEWKTTKFGTLVGHVIDAEKPPGWLHKYVLEKDDLTSDEVKMIDQALSELVI